MPGLVANASLGNEESRAVFFGAANQRRSQLTSIPGLPFVACSTHMYGMTNRVRHIHMIKAGHTAGSCLSGRKEAAVQ